MGLLDRIRGQGRICKTCGGVVEVQPGLLGCEPRDKLIIPGFPAYSDSRGPGCPDWISKEVSSET